LRSARTSLFVAILLATSWLAVLASVRVGGATPSPPLLADATADLPDLLGNAGAAIETLCELELQLDGAVAVGGFSVIVDATLAGGRFDRDPDGELAACSPAPALAGMALSESRVRSVATIDGVLDGEPAHGPAALLRCGFVPDSAILLPTAADFLVDTVEVRDVDMAPIEPAPQISVATLVCYTLDTTTTLPDHGFTTATMVTTTSIGAWPSGAGSSTTSSTSTTMPVPVTGAPVSALPHPSTTGRAEQLPGAIARAIAVSTTVPPAPVCGNPTGYDSLASDALFVLSAAVGASRCEPCVCSLDGNRSVAASDALLLLKAATGQPVALDCPPCDDIDIEREGD